MSLELDPARNGRPDAEGVGPLVAHFFRHESGRVTATLTRIFGFEHLDTIEDAVQEALLKALDTWPFHGVPENPSAWVIQVARNRALDVLRRGSAWTEKRALLAGESRVAGTNPSTDAVGYATEVTDDQLRMIFACCHPLLSRESQVALTLKIVGGFSVQELARAFLVSDTAMAQRLVRAKRKLREAGAGMAMPPAREMADRLDAALDVLYLMFNEGYGATEGADLIRRDLCREAIRLCSILAAHPATGLPRTHALAALMSFQAARLDTRVGPEGEAVLLAEQDRGDWDRQLIQRGVFHLDRAGRGDDLSELHLQAEIAAHHALAASWDDTDWDRILACYDRLISMNPSPVVAVNRAVALAEARSPAEALDALDALPDMVSYYPVHAVRASLLSRVGRVDEARAAYQAALEAPVPDPVRRVLERRLEGLR